MNWKNISDNWKTFTSENGIMDNSEENHYFYGKQEIYQGTEDFLKFRIFYKNKFNKSAEFTAFANSANSFSITIPISTDSPWTLKITRTSFLNRFFKSSSKLKVETNLHQFEDLIPLKSIESLSDEFRDMEISVSRFGKMQNEKISADTKVLQLRTRHQPENLNQLNNARILMHTILENLNKKEKIKPAT